MERSTRPCKYCGRSIDLSVGRRDRKFCNETCKNRYHNKQAFEEEKEAKRINKILKKNRDILKTLAVRKDSGEIPKEKMLKAGFDFNYYTHHKQTVHYNHQYTICYDYGYRLITLKNKTDVYKIVKAFEEKEE